MTLKNSLDYGTVRTGSSVLKVTKGRIFILPFAIITLKELMRMT